MAVKILIQRRIKPGMESELDEAIGEIRSKAVHAQGFISGETLRSVKDRYMHLVISAWDSIEDWNNWVNTPERKAFERKIEVILTEPATITPYQTVAYVDPQEMLDKLADESTVSE